jgi:hypothetical protein
MNSWEEYVDTLDNVGDSILNWADPKQDFIGYTNVSGCSPEVGCHFKSFMGQICHSLTLSSST